MPGAATENAHGCKLSAIFKVHHDFAVVYMCDICGAFWTATPAKDHTRLRRVPRNSFAEAAIKDLWVYKLRESQLV